MARRLSGNGGGNRAPRARSFAGTVPMQSGSLASIGKMELLIPCAFAKTSGSANLAIDPASGAVSAASAIPGGSSQSLTGTVTGADGCMIPFTTTLSTLPAAPAAPTLSLTGGVGQVSLAWADGADNGSAINGHNLYRGTVSGSLSLIGTIATGSPYVDGSLANNTPYFYKLSAINGIGEGALSTEQSATTATTPAAPTVALTGGSNQVSVAWTDGSTGGSAISSHKIYRSTTSGFTPGSGNLLASPSGASPYLDSTAVNGTTYYYAISAVNAVGEGTRAAQQSATPSTSSPTIADVSRPAAALAAFYNGTADSTMAGVGSATNSDWPSQFRTIVTTNVVSGFHMGVGGNSGTAISKIGNGGQSGQNSTFCTGIVTANASGFPAEMGRTLFYHPGINDYNTAISGFARDWPAQVKTNYAAAAAAVTGGDGAWDFCPIPEYDRSSGLRTGADYNYFVLDMAATYGRKFVDMPRHMRHVRKLAGITAGTADDWCVNKMGVIPYSYRGNSANTDIANYDAVWITNAGIPNGTTPGLAYAEGTICWDSTNLKSYVKLGASGAGSWTGIDIKHLSKWGNIAIARMAADIAAAIEGIGPPFVCPARFRVAADAAASAVVGQVVYTGTANAFGLRDYADNPVTTFAISPTGQITRTASGTLTEGITELVGTVKNGNGVLTFPVDIYVARASTVTAPPTRTIASPGISVTARDAHGMADGTKFSGAIRINPSSLAAGPTILQLIRAAAPTTALLFKISSSGVVQVQVWNSSNTQIGALNFGGAGTTITTGSPFNILFAIDSAGGTKIGYVNETAATISASLSAGTIPLADTNPIMLAGAGPRELYNGGVAYLGGIDYMMFVDDYIDWTVAANRRALFGSGSPFTPATRTPYAAIGTSGISPRFEQWGGIGDWMWGSPDGSYGPKLLSTAYKAVGAGLMT